MKTEVRTDAIILNKLNYGEYDRILTLITKNNGKVKVIAKSVRKQKSKLASSLDYFCQTNIGYFPNSRGEINRLVSSNLNIYFDNIISDIDRINLGFSFMKTIDKSVEGDNAEPYYDLLFNSFIYLNKSDVDIILVSNWFYCQFLKIYGHMPNLLTEKNGNKLEADVSYEFSLDGFCFYESTGQTALNKDDIKYFRLIFSLDDIDLLSKIAGSADINRKLFPIIDAMFRNFNLV